MYDGAGSLRADPERLGPARLPTATLAHLSVAELKAALEMSWAHGAQKRSKRR